jgi:hypothetical protein
MIITEPEIEYSAMGRFGNRMLVNRDLGGCKREAAILG